MQRTVAVVTMMVAGAGVVLPGCSSTRPHPARLGDDDILAMVRSQRHIDVIWMGTDHWTVTATGMDGGGHGPYDVHHRTNEPDYYAFDHLLLDSTHSRLASHFGLLFPLLESDDAEVVLTALYCYGQVTCGTVTPLDVPVSNEHLAELGAALRRLMNEHRDVRVRCMAANLLFRRELFELADLDRMLSDEDLAVRLIGTRTTYAVLKYIAGRLPFPPQAIGIPHRVGIRRQIAMGGTGAVKEALASILLEHLNDTTVPFGGIVTARSGPSWNASGQRDAGRTPSRRPETLPEHIDWIRQSWWARQEAQQALLAWWQANKYHVLADYGPDWRPPAGRQARRM